MRQFLMASAMVGITLPWFGLSLSAQTPLPIPQASPPAPATIDVYFLSRAKNLARQAAINANGGLEKYRPDPIMFGPAVQTPYVRNANGSITFTFTGGSPGATPSIETVATVSPDGSVKLEYNGALRNGSSNPTPPPTSVTSPSPSPAPGSPPSPAPAPIASPSPSTPDPFLPSVSAGSPPPPFPPVSSPPTPPSPLPSPQGSSETNWADQDAFFAKARNLARQAAIKANGGLEKYRPEASMFGPSAQTPFVKNADGSITFKFKGGAPGSTQLTVESEVVVGPTGSVETKYNGPIR